MKLSAKGAAFVREHEGFRSKWYLCPAGVPTIGVGMTMRSKAFKRWWKQNKGTPFRRGATITRDEADHALQFMFREEYGAAVDRAIGTGSVKQNVYDTMCSMSYNCGPGSLKWKWAKAAIAGKIGEAAKRLRTTAVTAKGKRLRGLVRRRKEEALLLEKGVYTGIGHIEETPEDALADGVLMRGERGKAVAVLIMNLSAMGYYDGSMDDVFGHGTEAALVEFQRDRGLVPDGYAGPDTLKEIKVAMAERHSKPVEGVPEEVEELVEKLDKPMGQSKTWIGALRGKFSGLVSGGGAVYAWNAWQGLDPMVQIAVVVAILIVLGFGIMGLRRVFKDRSGYAELGREVKALIS